MLTPATDGSVTLADVIAVLDGLFPPDLAEPWDAVGLVCGDPARAVRRVHFAIDPVEAVAAEALAVGADLLVCHHPLFLRPVHGVAATTAKGRLVSRLIGAGVALYTAHTNADNARPGVSDALADLLGVVDTVPLEAAPAPPLDKLVTFVPHDDAGRVLDALAAAGAGGIGNYRRCAWTVRGEGTFTPVDGADPAVGRVGEVTDVPETRIETVLPRARRADVVAALLSAHPYEEPAYDVLELALPPSPRGTGRIGRLASPTSAGDFARLVADRLPATAGGVRLGGDPERRVERVAVCGGAGDSLLAAARRADADAYLTADLRHHPASEHLAEREGTGPVLLDAAHWATEWPWLRQAATQIGKALAPRGTTVEATVSELPTDPWVLAVPQR